MPNRSNDTDGTDDPNHIWMQRVVRLKQNPEWGCGRVLRWYPAAGGQAQRLRVLFAQNQSPQVVSVLDVEILTVDGAHSD